MAETPTFELSVIYPVEDECGGLHFATFGDLDCDVPKEILEYGVLTKVVDVPQRMPSTGDWISFENCLHSFEVYRIEWNFVPETGFLPEIIYIKPTRLFMADFVALLREGFVPTD